MDNSSSDREPIERDSVREIPKWIRRYAQNRTMPLLAFFGVFIVFSAAFGGLGYALRQTYASEQVLGFSLCILATLLVCAALALFIVRGDRLFRAISERYYAREGEVVLGSSSAPRRKLLGWAVTLAFVVCLLGSVALASLGHLPARYMQPVTALYTVPFLVFLTLQNRAVAGLLPLLWPVLYTAHAALVAVGAFPSTGRWPKAHMLIATIGYGSFTALVGHIVNRAALHRLRSLAHVDSNDSVFPEAGER